MEDERKPLINAWGDGFPLFQPYGSDDKSTTVTRTTTSRKPRGHSRAATLGHFPPLTSSLSSSILRMRNSIQQDLGLGGDTNNRRRHTKSMSLSSFGYPMTNNLSNAVELGRQELFIQTPFTAVFGLQAKEREFERAFANLVVATTHSTDDGGDVGVSNQKQPNDMEQRRHLRQASEQILQELERVDAPEKVLTTTPFLFAILVATASQFSVGYNTGVMNAPEKVVFVGHTTAVWSWAVAAFAIGGPLGAIWGGRLADSRGRRGALLMDIWTFALGGMIQTFAIDMSMIVIARFIIGFASGFSSVLVPIYLGELAPPRLRGALGTLTQFAMVIGILVADLLAFPFATVSGWRYLFAVTPCIAFLQVLASPFLLESPRWLLNHDPKSTQARSILRQLRGMTDEMELESELSNYIIAEAVQHQDEEKSQFAIIQQMFQDSRLRILLISSLVLHMGQQLGGINAVFYYSTSFFEGVIDNPLVGTTLVGAVNVVATYGALLLMDSCGRRSLMLWSTGGMFLSCIVIVLSLLGYLSKILALVAVVTYVCCFEIGLGPIPWLIVAEMFEGKYVTVAMSLCSQLNWSCNFIIGLVFPWMNETLGAFSFGPFALILSICFIYAWFILPETLGLTPDQVLLLLLEEEDDDDENYDENNNNNNNPVELTMKGMED